MRSCHGTVRPARRRKDVADIAIRSWKLLTRTPAFVERPWVEVSSDTVEMHDGRVRGAFHHIVLPEYAIVVPVREDGRFVMVREYKHGPGCVCLNAPAGGLHHGEAPLDGARRELLEETGYASDAWHALGSFVLDGSVGGGRAHVFLARGARSVGSPAPDDTEEIEVVLLDANDVRAALASGEVVLMPTATALGLAFLFLNGRR